MNMENKDLSGLLDVKVVFVIFNYFPIFVIQNIDLCFIISKLNTYNERKSDFNCQWGPAGS